jgi:hypothetical protein
MKKLLATAALGIALVPSLAQAGMRLVYASGYWNVALGTLDDGNRACSLHSRDRQADQFYVKFDGDDLFVQIFKPTWRIPNGTKVTIDLGFDQGLFRNGNITATGSTVRGIGMITFHLTDAAVIEDFFQQFRDADEMWVQFPDGNEQTWSINMTGSRQAARVFEGCMGVLANATQPFGAHPSQPFGRQAEGGEEEQQRHIVETGS